MSDREREHDPARGRLDADRPLGLYVHFPFCRSRCPYCDFATGVREPIPHDAYADAVVGEIEARSAWFRGAELRSIYFGGGTPGLWRPDALGRVLEAARGRLSAAGPLEVTVEANPGEIDGARLQALRAEGVNRLSFGAQAFQNRLLQRIGRGHGAAAIAPALAAARAAGLDNLCADLMFGLPGQHMGDWRASLAALLALAPEHITAYALTVERGTPFGSLERAGKLERPGDDAVAAMSSTCHDVLAKAGYEHYEISSYARPGRRSVHNMLYWTGGAYLGVGVAAASFRPLADGSGWRFTNPRSLDMYLRSATANRGNPRPASIELRTPADLENEALWLALRTSDGVDRAAHARRFGGDPLDRPRSAAAHRCVEAGWLEVTPDHVRLTAEGFLFADEVASRLWR
jgi:oxygen-independent coproporphyrinogen-3 oxidase